MKRNNVFLFYFILYLFLFEEELYKLADYLLLTEGGRESGLEESGVGRVGGPSEERGELTGGMLLAARNLSR